MKTEFGANGKVAILKKGSPAPVVAKVASMLLAHGEADWTVWMDVNGKRVPLEGLFFDEENKRVVVLNEDS